MKITERTTLLELEFEKARLGVSGLFVASDPHGVYVAIARTSDGAIVASARSIADAIDAVLALVEGQIAVAMFRRSRAIAGPS